MSSYFDNLSRAVYEAAQNDEDRVMDWDWLADRICDRGLEAEDMKL